ncbi:hypothetical protein, partial [Acanthopleuribacter pedis]
PTRIVTIMTRHTQYLDVSHFQCVPPACPPVSSCTPSAYLERSMQTQGAHPSASRRVRALG